jgi:hypothetical protein
MDDLIYRRETPGMIGVFINPGRTPEQPEPAPQNWAIRLPTAPTRMGDATFAIQKELP